MSLKYKEDTVNNYYAYLTEDGNDSNSGLTPALPVKTIDKLVQVLEAYTGSKRRVGVIVKHKFVDEAITTTRTKPITFECLNRTIFDGSSGNVIQIKPLDILNNAIIKDYTTYFVYGAASITKFNSCIFSSCSSGISHTSPCIFTYCVILNSALHVYAPGIAPLMTVRQSVVSGLIRKGNDNSTVSFLNTIFTGSNTCLISFMDYCNLHGTINGLTNSELVALGHNINGISADPLFNDSANNVYTVTNSSPCLYAGTNNQHIGIGEALYKTGLELLTDAVASSNIEASGNKLIRTNPDSDAYLETKVFSNGANRIVNIVDLAATLGFVADALVQSVQLDSGDSPYPYFLTFKIKVGTSEAICNASDWIVLPFAQQPTTDEDGVGNGSTVWDETEIQTLIKLNYFKLYIYVQNLS